jgi:hypothetical protein
MIADPSAIKSLAGDEATSHDVGTASAVAFKAEWLSRFTSSRFRSLGQEFIWIGLGQATAVVGSLVGV